MIARVVVVRICADEGVARDAVDRGVRRSWIINDRPSASIPEEPVIDGVRLRYINIAINPRPPSADARLQVAAGRQAKKVRRA